jgi:hypothetical protein
MSASKEAAAAKAAELRLIASWAGMVAQDRVRDLCQEAAYHLEGVVRMHDALDAAIDAAVAALPEKQKQEDAEETGFIDLGPPIDLRKCPHCGSTNIKAGLAQCVCQECGRGVSIADRLRQGASFPEVAREFNLEVPKRAGHDLPKEDGE